MFAYFNTASVQPKNTWVSSYIQSPDPSSKGTHTLIYVV